MKILALIFGSILLIKIIGNLFSLSMDLTKEGDVLLWYGRKQRKFKKLFTLW